MRANYEALIAYLESRAEWSEEYETTHDDAGGNYLELLNGGDWPEYTRKIGEWIGENLPEVELTSDQLDDVVQHLKDYGCFEAVSGSIWGPRKTNGCTVDGWPIGEIEDQISFADLEREDQPFADSPFLKGMLRKAADDNRLCLRYEGWEREWSCAYQYISTDAAWFAVASKEAIEDAIKEVTGEEE